VTIAGETDACAADGCARRPEFVYFVVRRSSAVQGYQRLCAECASRIRDRGLTKGHYVDEYLEPIDSGGATS
jgi:hypothetical protein